ncbi:MAG: DUF3299 domain-containing protein [Steroidobacteraceae bacterium]|nr:DUF3299 domain-containing protein [Steroidobacteraceae bacterium]
MKSTRVAIALLFASALVAGCGGASPDGGREGAAASGPAAGPAAAAAGDGERARELEWDDLLAPEYRDDPLQFPEMQPEHGALGEAAPAAPQLVFGGPNPELQGRFVRLPGFVVPLGLDERGRVKEFLFAPYAGACIHVPAPPPAQIVHVTPAAPIETRLFEPYWIVGRMELVESATALATTSYRMRGAAVLPYR